MARTDQVSGSTCGSSAAQRPSAPMQSTALPAADWTRARRCGPTNITPVSVRPVVGSMAAAASALVVAPETAGNGWNGSGRPAGAALRTSRTDGNGIRPRSGEGVTIGAGGSISGVGAGGKVEVDTEGPGPPQAPRATTPASRPDFRASSAPLFHQIPKTIKVGLQLLRDNPPQDAGLHQRCQDPRELVGHTQFHHRALRGFRIEPHCAFG